MLLPLDIVLQLQEALFSVTILSQAFHILNLQSPPLPFINHQRHMYISMAHYLLPSILFSYLLLSPTPLYLGSSLHPSPHNHTLPLLFSHLFLQPPLSPYIQKQLHHIHRVSSKLLTILILRDHSLPPFDPLRNLKVLKAFKESMKNLVQIVIFSDFKKGFLTLTV